MKEILKQNQKCEIEVVRKTHHPFIRRDESCGKNAKYKVEYLNPVNGKPLTVYVCVAHLKRLQKRSKGIMQRFQYDDKFKSQSL